MSDVRDDRQLLDAYMNEHSEAAFAELVRRYIGLVYRTAARQLHAPDAAEDVAQTVFALLAQKAATVRGRTVAGWLFAAARYAAANERRAIARRRRHERRAARPEAVVPDRSGDEMSLSPLLDDALAHLGKADRESVLLRYYGNHDAAFIATALGISSDAARQRLSRAVDRLRKYFAARGMPITAAGVAAALEGGAVVPAGLPPKVAAAATAPHSPDRLAAVAAVIWAMRRTRTRVAAAVGLAVIAVATLGGFVANSAIDSYRTVNDPLSGPKVRPRLLLSLPWDGRDLPLPAAATFPDEVRETAEYRRWLRTREPRTFRSVRPDGRTYVADAAFARNVDGATYVTVPRVRVLRRDGTLLSETLNDERRSPRRWCRYAADGKTRQVLLTAEAFGPDRICIVKTARFFNPDGTSREYRAGNDGTAQSEWLLDPQGRRLRLLHGSDR